MEQVLFGDVLNNINNHLNVYDLYILSYVNKHYNKLNIKKMILDRINANLKKDLMCDIDVFKKYMEDNDIYICGNYIKHCIVCPNDCSLCSIDCGISDEYYYPTQDMNFRKIIGKYYVTEKGTSYCITHGKLSGFRYIYNCEKRSIVYYGIDEKNHKIFDNLNKFYKKDGNEQLYILNLKRIFDKYNMDNYKLYK